MRIQDLGSDGKPIIVHCRICGVDYKRKYEIWHLKGKIHKKALKAKQTLRKLPK